MAKAFETAERIGIAEFWLKAYRRTQVLYQPALPRDSKLFSKVALDSRNNFKRQFLHLLYNIAKKKGQSLKAFALHSSLFKCGIDDY